jgi:beta-lactamase regulating signal transducer with metallopeptidase domain/predicted  nucleic acid-binding Zn-ribbon protein
MDAFSWLVALTLRCTVVLSVALGLGLFLRRSSAVARHRLLSLTAVSLLALPFLAWVLPSLELPLALPGLEPSSPAPVAALSTPAETMTVLGEQGPPKPGQESAHAPLQDAAPRPRGVDYETALAVGVVAAWLIGVAAALVYLGRALLRERRLLAASRPLDGPWLETLEEARRTFGMARPVRLLTSDAIETPLTCGWPRPAVFLPPIAERWTEDRRRLVVQHELVHVVSGDGLRRLAWRLVGALYWFHPLARIAERQAGLVGEHACDETVVRLGTRPSVYARHLLEIAGALHGRPALFATALPMVERNQLERRLVMILDTRISFRNRGVAIACLAFLAATDLSVACAALARPQRETGSASVGHKQKTENSAVPAQAADPARSAEAPWLDGFNGTMLDGDHTSYQHQQDLGGDRRLRARIDGPVVFDERTGEIRELPRGSLVLIETRGRQKNSQRMLITEDEGEPRYEWWLNGDARPVDADARAWLKEAFAAVAAFREIGEIHGHVGSLQGQIGAIQGRIGSLQGRIGAIQGEEGSLQGKIGAIQGEQGSLQGEIGSHQGAIGSLRAARGVVASDDLGKQIDREIQAHEAAIQKLEAEKDDGELARRLAQAEADLRAFQQSSRGKIADLQRQIDALRSEDEIGELEKEIDGLHADERIDEIERRVAPRLDRLKVLIDKLGR